MATSSPQEPNAVEMLKKDHETVTQLFAQYERAAEADRSAIATQIFKELEIHATLEEEIFYPAVREQADTEELDEDEEIEAAEDDEEDEDDVEEGDEEVLEDSDESDDVIAVAYEEHAAVKELIAQLRKLEPNSAEYKERFAELKEAVQDHVSEEEEVVFPAAQLDLDLDALGEQMEQRRISLASSMAA